MPSVSESWSVHKFGGTSLGNVANLNNLLAVVQYIH